MVWGAITAVEKLPRQAIHGHMKTQNYVRMHA